MKKYIIIALVSGTVLTSCGEYNKVLKSTDYEAIQELQMFMEYFPTSSRRQDAQQMIFDLQDKLVMKDYLAAKLYYDLGSYTGNSTYSTTGNNYLSCIVTAQNALKDYPYTKMREDLSILVLRAKYDMAKASVEEKKEERMRETIDEYYSFKNESSETDIDRCSGI